MELSEKTLNYIRSDIERKLGIPYEEFIKLDFDEQERLIREYRKNHVSKSRKDTIIMVGSGEDAIFTRVKKGSKHMLSDGTFYEAGLSLEESEERLNDRIDNMIYSKPKAFVRRLVRKNKK